MSTATNDGAPPKAKKKKSTAPKTPKLSKAVYEAELFRLQTEFVKLQEWVRHSGARLVIIFEGRDAAGKGGAIKRITEYLSPRVAQIAALPAPNDRERGQWYYQRYIAHLPAKGEIVLFDRSWYNRAGIEKVMGFCTPQEYVLFLRQTPIFEQMLIDDGILLRKYWFSVSDDEQLRRFRARRNDPVRRWKLSTMDLESVYRWEDYSRAKDEMMVHTDTPVSPWYVVESDIKKHARLNMMSHLLSTIEYYDVEEPKVKLPSAAGGEWKLPAPAAGAVDVRRRLCGHVDRMMQVYIPATLAMLQQLVAEGSLWPINGTAFAVTPTLREAYAEGDDDELGEVALQEAALASLRLLAAESGDGPDALPPRRAVLAAQVDDVTYRPDLDDAVVRLGAPVAIDDVVAAYVDNAGAEPAVTAAMAVIDAADLGDEDADLTVGDAQDHDLAWYANQELPFLLDLL